ncbi:MAG TPA: helix-turn-helix domain-containing protein, partial [Blastocatellia bacterium]|nr:helix-turn-helix domain-containing protein [Blastocatellia bacterium]
EPERAGVLLNPLRIRIIEELLREPESASGLARSLNLPRQKINYHLRELEKEGLVELVEERRKGNCVERVVRATARSYLVNPAALGAIAADPSAVKDQFSSSYLIAVAARAIKDVALLRERAAKAGKKLPTLTLQTEVRFGSASDQNAFVEELSNAVARLVTRYHDEKSPGGRRFQVLVGSYPTPGRAVQQVQDER